MTECTLMNCSGLVIQTVLMTLLSAGLVPGVVYGVMMLNNRRRTPSVGSDANRYRPLGNADRKKAA